MSHSSPHLTLSTCTSYLSPISPTFPTISQTHIQDFWYTMNIYPATFHGRVADQRKSPLSQVMSPTSSRPKQSILKTSSPEELSLPGIFGQIRIKYRKDLSEKITKILSPKMWRDLEKLAPRSPLSNHRCIPIMTQRRALQSRNLKMENYEKWRLHHCICKIERTVCHLEYQLHWKNLLQ